MEKFIRALPIRLVETKLFDQRDLNERPHLMQTVSRLDVRKVSGRRQELVIFWAVIKPTIRDTHKSALSFVGRRASLRQVPMRRSNQKVTLPRGG